MKTRWLAGVAIFALGFGCAQVMKITTAGADDGALIDDGLSFIDNGNSFELINTGDDRYLVLVQHKDEIPAPDPKIEQVEGSLTISKEGLIEARISRIQDLGILALTMPPYRDCHPGIEDCVEPWKPLPGPRPPKPFIIDYERRR